MSDSRVVDKIGHHFDIDREDAVRGSVGTVPSSITGGASVMRVSSSAAAAASMLSVLMARLLHVVAPQCVAWCVCATRSSECV